MPALQRHTQPFLALTESVGSLARQSGASQSAVDFRCKISGNPDEAWRPDQPRTPRPVCCFPYDPVLTVISPECTGGEAPLEFVKLHHDSDTQAWDLAV